MKWKVLVLVAFLAVTVMPASAQQNLLVDPAFEGEAYNLVSQDVAADVQFNVPSGWWGGVVLSPHDTFWMNVHPTGFPHTAGYKRNGNRSFHIGRGGGTFTAYIYQQVYVVPDTEVNGGSWGYIENDTGGAVIRAGIDPTGGTDPFSPNVVWAGWTGNLRQWNYTGVTTRAGDSGVATLFLFATQSQPSNPNGVYWDEAFFYGTPGAAPAQPQAPAAPSANVQTVSPTVRINVRSGPGVSYDRIGAAAPGEAYEVLDESGGWYAINYNGAKGFVYSTFVTLGQGQPTSGGGAAPANTAPPADSLPFTANYALRMRATPDRNAAEVGRVAYTVTVQAVGRTADNIWVQIVADGQTGWVLAQYGLLDGNIASLPVR